MTSGQKAWRPRRRNLRATLLAASLVLLLATGTGAAATGGDLLGSVKAAVCRYNAALLAQAYEVFTIQVGRPPANLVELNARQFVRPPRCPAGGVYHVNADGSVVCSIHDQRDLRVEEVGVYRALPGPNHLPLSTLAFTPRKDARAVFYARWTPDGLPHAVEIRWLGPDARPIQVNRVQALAKSQVVAYLLLRDRTRPLPAGQYQAFLVVDGRPAGDCTFWLTESGATP